MPNQNLNTVLILDDEIDICYLLSGILSKKGYRCILANSLTEGVEQLKNHSPRFVFLDNHLPDGSGLDQLKYLKSLSPDSKFILMSAFYTNIDQIKANAEGAIGFLSKPLNLKSLDSVLSLNQSF